MQALSLDKQYGAPYANLTSLYITYAQNLMEHGENPSAYLDTAAQYGQDALKINENDFESINDWPVCLAERGLYLAQPLAGHRSLVWAPVPTGPTLAPLLGRLRAGRLARAPNGSLLVFLDQGRVYSLKVVPP